MVIGEEPAEAESSGLGELGDHLGGVEIEFGAAHRRSSVRHGPIGGPVRPASGASGG